RILAVPIPARDYTGLVAAPDGSIFYLENIPNETGSVLFKYSFKDRKPTEFVRGVFSVTTSNDRKNLLYRSPAGWFIVGTAAAPRPGEGR
ncbi:hypothetical protein ABLW26_23235, partial [Salmonella enterica]|uniref:hypothetical protein n=1 Tax=Salmonella enterica TaxID=28901 RepID=UPI0032B3ED71